MFAFLSVGIVLLWRTHALLHLAVATIIGTAILHTALCTTDYPFRHAFKQHVHLSLE